MRVMDGPFEQIVRELSDFSAIEIKQASKAQDTKLNFISVVTTLATFLSVVTITALPMTIAGDGSADARATNVLYFLSLFLSITAASIGLLEISDMHYSG
jgi:hypothetical protein